MHKLLTTLTNLHGSMAKPMTKTSVVGLCRLVELVKTVRQTYLRHGTVIARSVAHIVQRLSFQALTIIASAKVGPNSLFYWLYYTKTSFSLKWFSVVQTYDLGLVTILTFCWEIEHITFTVKHHSILYIYRLRTMFSSLYFLL